MRHMELVNGSSKSSTAARASSLRGGHVLCLENRGYEASLEVGKVYSMLRPTRAVPPGWIRVVDESGEDYLYPMRRFLALELPPRAKRALAGR